MKILYATQAQHHQMRHSLALIDALTAFAQVDILTTGPKPLDKLTTPVMFKKYTSLTADKNFVPPREAQSMRMIKRQKLARDIAELPVENYDIIISDFESLASWSSHFKNKFCVSLSSSNSFFESQPLAASKKNFADYLIKNFAPSWGKIDFHYEPYSSGMHTPIINKQLRSLPITDEGHIVVYLPGYQLNTLSTHLKKISEIQWHVFSPEIQKEVVDENVLFKIIEKDYIKSITTAHGLISRGQFHLTAEALFLGKKLMVIPQEHDYEEQCNARSLEKIGITKIKKVDSDFTLKVMDWLFNAPIFKIDYPDNAQEIAQKIISLYQRQ